MTLPEAQALMHKCLAEVCGKDGRRKEGGREDRGEREDREERGEKIERDCK